MSTVRQGLVDYLETRCAASRTYFLASPSTAIAEVLDVLPAGHRFIAEADRIEATKTGWSRLVSEVERRVQEGETTRRRARKGGE